MNKLFCLIAALMLSGPAVAQANNPIGPDKVVYHLHSGVEQA